MANNSFIFQFAAMVANVLNINVPKIEFVDKLNTPTQIAAVSNDGKHIAIKSSCTQMDKLFAIAHEMRHVWQEKNGGIGAYTSNTSTQNYTIFNDQYVEIDANAFAKVIIEMTFGITPLFNGLDESVKRKITYRAEIIKKDFLP